ncbi:MAG: hypothetical protein WA208_09650 [Thermoanaerobaculia bacterium]
MGFVRPLFCVTLFAIAAPAAFASDPPETPEPASLIATLLPSSALTVLAQLPIEGEPALELIPAATHQILVGRITSDGTKVIGCVDSDEALRGMLEAPSSELRKKSRSEVQ